MNALMPLQVTVVIERLVTHVAGIWTLTNMYALMLLQSTVLTE
jgi:hypothetical protein